MNTNNHYAGFWWRVAAYCLDKVFIVLLVDLLLLPLSTFFEIYSEMAIYTLLVLMAAVYHIFCWIKFAGTPGKLLLKLKVLNVETGQKITLKQAIIRYISYIPSAVILLCGFLWIAFDEKKQGWHDKLAQTMVIRNRS